jgi:large subunit ribosomal protein L17
MRHKKTTDHLGRKPAHKKAMLSNMASSLIMNKRITTTVPKAKALRKYVEPLITKSKNDSLHSRRIVFKYLQDKFAVSELFREVSPKVLSRPGGYIRILKTGTRQGDSAEMCVIELVDYNENMLTSKQEEEEKSGKSRGRRRRSKKKSTASESQQQNQQAASQQSADESADTSTVEPQQSEPAGKQTEQQQPSSTSEQNESSEQHDVKDQADSETHQKEEEKKETKAENKQPEQDDSAESESQKSGEDDAKDTKNKNKDEQSGDTKE